MREDEERLFERALALEPEGRIAFIDSACSEDPELRAELVSLIEQADPADEFFDHLNAAVFAPSFSVSGEDAPPGSPDIDLSAGEMIGHYEIVSLIGRGGMGAVYRAHDTRLDREVALKFLPAYLGTHPEAREQLLREARSAAALDHPNVCSIYEIADAEDGRMFIAMACYDGETLKEKIRRDSLSIEECVSTALQVARALSAAHARGIVHRDVKPGNILVGSDGAVRLLDFGLAMVMDKSVTSSRLTPGTVGYMSPEQARNLPLDARTDLWSLGVVLYEMLSGVRPFRAPAAAGIVHAILHHEPDSVATRRPDVPPILGSISSRLLQKDPAARYAAAEDLVNDLARVLPSSSHGFRSRISGKRRALLVGSAVLLVAVAGLLPWRSLRDNAAASRFASGRAQPSIAVLPLASLSGDSADETLARGITEELTAVLASSGGMRVIASTSVSGFRKRELDIREIADSLGVSTLLEGALQKVGSRIRLQVRLIDGNDGSTRWSESYDREFSEMLSVRDEVALAVASELDLRFDRDRQLMRHGTRNMAAYEAYLRASDPVLLRSQSGIWRAQKYFEEAIATDSMYAAAHAGLALAYVRRARHASDPGMPVPKLLDHAEREARQAVALDGVLAEGHYALGRVHEAKLDFSLAESEIRRAIAIDPSRSVYRKSLSELHAWAGRPAEALAEAYRALETDPLNPYALAAVASGLYGNRRYDEALLQFQSLASIKPPLKTVAFAIAECYAKKQMWPEAIAVLRPHAEAGDPLFIALLGHVVARTGQRDEANRILVDLVDRSRRTGSGAFHIAVVHAGLGDYDKTFDWLNKAIDDRSISSIIMGPTFEDLHADPRFERLRRRLVR